MFFVLSVFVHALRLSRLVSFSVVMILNIPSILVLLPDCSSPPFWIKSSTLCLLLPPLSSGRSRPPPFSDCAPSATCHSYANAAASELISGCGSCLVRRILLCLLFPDHPYSFLVCMLRVSPLLLSIVNGPAKSKDGMGLSGSDGAAGIMQVLILFGCLRKRM